MDGLLVLLGVLVIVLTPFLILAAFLAGLGAAWALGYVAGRWAGFGYRVSAATGALASVMLLCLFMTDSRFAGVRDVLFPNTSSDYCEFGGSKVDPTCPKKAPR